MQKDKKEVKKNIADACEKACEKENWEEVKKAEDANIFEAFKKAAENIEAENAAAIANDPNLEVVNGQLQRKPEDQCVAAPDGVEMGVEIENSDLSKRLEELFSLAKKNVDFKDDLDVVATGTDIDLDQYTTVELPNGMTVKVHKDSHKSNKEDMARLIEAAGGEMDCSDEDDEGNLIDHSIVAEEEVKSEYTPGMLRNKSMVKNAAAEDAQKRLNSKVSEEEAARRVTIPREKHNEDLPLDNKINWEDVLVKLDNASAKTVTEIDNGAPVQKKNIHSNEKIWEALTLLGQAAIEKRTLEGKPPAPKGTIEKIKSLREQISDLQHKLAQAQKDEIRAIQDSFTIDWSCFADKMFQSKVNKICEKKMTKVDVLGFEFEMGLFPNVLDEAQIGRASCRERVSSPV